MKNKKNILIVGVSSLVGSNLAIELKKDFNVFGTFNKNSKNLKNKKNFFKVDLSLKEPFKLDWREWDEAILGLGIFAVVMFSKPWK